MADPFPQRPFADRVALVTGVSRRGGIGFAIAHRLAVGGADLVIHAFSSYDEGKDWHEPGGAEACATELADTGARVELIEANLAEVGTPALLVDRAHQVYDGLDILVANHTHWAGGGILEVASDSLDRHYAVIVRGSLLLVQEMAKRRKAGAGGRVVLFSSGQHLGPMPDEIGYVAAKGALVQAVPTLSHELIDRGITVNAVNPGPNDTGWISDEFRPRLQARAPLGRIGTPEDTADLVGFLCSEAGGWITGQVLNSEGGFRRG